MDQSRFNEYPNSLHFADSSLTQSEVSILRRQLESEMYLQNIQCDEDANYENCMNQNAGDTLNGNDQFVSIEGENVEAESLNNEELIIKEEFSDGNPFEYLLDNSSNEEIITSQSIGNFDHSGTTNTDFISQNSLESTEAATMSLLNELDRAYETDDYQLDIPDFVVIRNLTNEHTVTIPLDPPVNVKDKNSTSFECVVCLYKTKNGSNLLLHMGRQHKLSSLTNQKLKRKFIPVSYQNIDKNIFRTKNFLYNSKFLKFRYGKYVHVAIKIDESDNIVASVNKTEILKKSNGKKCDNSKPLFVCEYCRCSSFLKCSVVMHVKRQHPNLTLLECNLCKSVTEGKEEMRKHKQASHGVRYLVKCKKCPFETESNSFLKEHSQSEHHSRKFECKFCNYISKSKIVFACHVVENHIKKQHNDGKKYKRDTLKCKLCEYQTRLKLRLADHFIHRHTKKSDTNEKRRTFVCSYCNYQASSKLVVQRHRIWYHTFKCNSCRHRASTKYFLYRHMKNSHGVFHCQFCNYKTRLIVYFVKHNKLRHSSGHQDVLSCYKCSFECKHQLTLHCHLQKHDRDVARYRCNQCKFEGATISIMKQHIKKKHDTVKSKCILARQMKRQQEIPTTLVENNWTQVVMKFSEKGDIVLMIDEVEVFEDQILSEKSIYICLYCNYSSVLSFQVRSHLGTEHSKDFLLFTCEFCGYEANLKSTLRRHQSIRHPKQVNTVLLKCASCSFETKNERILDQHQRSKHSARSLKCDYCGMIFKKNVLEKHIKRVHHQKDCQFFSCSLCPFVTLEKCNLTKHLIKHKVCILQCYQCDYKSKVGAYLSDHIQLRHGQTNSQVITCPKCEFETDKNTALVEHLTKTHGQPGNYKCIKCEFIAVNEDDLEAHTKRQHLRLECGFCSYRAKYEIVLMRHINEQHKAEFDGMVPKMRDESQTVMKCVRNVRRKRDVPKKRSTSQKQSATNFKVIPLKVQQPSVKQNPQMSTAANQSVVTSTMTNISEVPAVSSNENLPVISPSLISGNDRKNTQILLFNKGNGTEQDPERSTPNMGFIIRQCDQNIPGISTPGVLLFPVVIVPSAATNVSMPKVADVKEK